MIAVMFTSGDNNTYLHYFPLLKVILGNINLHIVSTIWGGYPPGKVIANYAGILPPKKIKTKQTHLSGDTGRICDLGWFSAFNKSSPIYMRKRVGITDM